MFLSVGISSKALSRRVQSLVVMRLLVSTSRPEQGWGDKPALGAGSDQVLQLQMLGLVLP